MIVTGARSLVNALRSTVDDADLCGIAELQEELLAVLPGQSEGTYVGDADAGYCITNDCEMSGVELAFHQRGFSTAANVLRNGRAMGMAGLRACTEQDVSPLLLRGFSRSAFDVPPLSSGVLSRRSA